MVEAEVLVLVILNLEEGVVEEEDSMEVCIFVY